LDKTGRPFHNASPADPAFLNCIEVAMYHLKVTMKFFACLIAVVLMLCTLFVTAQTTEQLGSSGDSAYLKKNYGLAIDYYRQVAARLYPAFTRAGTYYNIACCYGLQKDNRNAWKYLDSAIYYGYNNYAHMLEDTDLATLQTDKKKWRLIKKRAQKRKNDLYNPQKAQLVTSDIHNFWKAYDAVQQDTARELELYQNRYFNKASAGLKDYFQARIYTAEAFVANQKKKRNFYKAIRANTLLVDQFKEPMRESFKKLKELYPQALFPSVYFVIGRWNSAGTVSSNGLLIGTDMLSKSDVVPLDELSLWERNNYKSIENLPYIVAHELVHYEQGQMGQDTTTLSACIREGMADFIGELIAGKNSNPRLHDFAKGKEKMIWAAFEKEIFLNRSYNWIANSGQETPDHPADLGYWTGYQVCKAYYEVINNPQQAIYDMLHIKDYKAFLEKSRYAEKVKLLP
jgi:Predicted Zn-dependent protease (DUF2268)